VTLIGGQLLALGVQIILQKLLLSEDEIKSWGWRIPFVLGALLSIVALYMRNSLDETSDYKSKANVARETKGSIVELLKHPKAVLTVMGLTMGGTLAFYTYTTYMQKFLALSVGLSKEQSTLLSFFTLLIFAMIQPVFGNISDRIGRKPLLITFGILGTFCTIFIFRIISNASESLFTIFLMMLFSLIIVSGYTSINAVVKAELFPAEIRALGVGLPYAITVAIFGGSAEYVALWFKSIDREFLFYWYVTICIFISLCVYYYMDDTKHTSFIGKY
jgi:MHS family alpha-ketoglutarate permease-like MFS transporter